MITAGQAAVQDDSSDTLSLIGQDITEFSIAPKNAHLVRHLDLSYNLLEKTEGLRRFVGLKELILDNNNLSDITLPILPFLHTLSLNKNRVYSLDTLLDKLAKYTPQLEYLSLLGNPACPNELMDGDEEDYQNYRYAVINRLKYLKFLDSRPVKADERCTAKRRVQVTHVIRALEQQEELCQEEEDSLSNIAPLSTEQDMSQRAGFGKRSYVYKGKNSEGNKFISDHDL